SPAACRSTACAISASAGRLRRSAGRPTYLPWTPGTGVSPLPATRESACQPGIKGAALLIAGPMCYDGRMEPLLNEAAATAKAVAEAMPDWLAATLILLVALAAALLLHEILHRLLKRMAASREMFWRSLVDRAGVP